MAALPASERARSAESSDTVNVDVRAGITIGPAGDFYTYDYQILIPSVPQGIYTGTPDYIATTT